MSFITRFFGRRDQAGEKVHPLTAVEKQPAEKENQNTADEKKPAGKKNQNSVIHNQPKEKDSQDPTSVTQSSKETKKAEKKAKSEEKRRIAAAKREALSKKKKNASKAKQKAKRRIAAAKRKKEQKPKLTEEERIALKSKKKSDKHEKKLQNFERKAARKEGRLSKIAEKKEIIREAKAQRKADAKAASDETKQRRKEYNEQKKYWRARGVGKTAHRLGITACIVAMLGLMTSGVVLVYKSDKINVTAINILAEAVINSPLSEAPRIVGPPVRWITSVAKPPIEKLVAFLKGKPKFTDFYFYMPQNEKRYTDYQEANEDYSPDEVVWRVNAGCDLMLYELAVTITDAAITPLVVNKFNALPETYTPPNLTVIPGTGMQADKVALDALTVMLEAASVDGLNISVASAYRSYEYQEILFDPKAPDTRENLDSQITRPGFSEHQTGLAFDLCVTGSKMQDFPGTPEAEWVAKHCERFGFLLRYTEEQEDVTGFRAEPWHVRYVGDEVITIMRDNDIKTLEEYKVKYIDHRKDGYDQTT